MQREKTTNAATTTRRKTNGKSTRTATSTMPVRASSIVASPEERHRMIEEAAYLRAERRGFTNGDPCQDWLEAEAEVDARIATWQRQGTRPRTRN